MFFGRKTPEKIKALDFFPLESAEVLPVNIDEGVIGSRELMHAVPIVVIFGPSADGSEATDGSISHIFALICSAAESLPLSSPSHLLTHQLAFSAFALISHMQTVFYSGSSFNVSWSMNLAQQ